VIKLTIVRLFHWWFHQLDIRY